VPCRSIAARTPAHLAAVRNSQRHRARLHPRAVVAPLRFHPRSLAALPRHGEVRLEGRSTSSRMRHHQLSVCHRRIGDLDNLVIGKGLAD